MALPYRLIRTAYRKHDGTEKHSTHSWVDAEMFAEANEWAGDTSDSDGVGIVEVLLTVEDEAVYQEILDDAVIARNLRAEEA